MIVATISDLPRLTRFLEGKKSQNLSVLSDWHKDNGLILPLTANMSWRWIFFRISGLDIKFPVKTNFQDLQSNWDHVSFRARGLFLTSSYLKLASEEELEQLVTWKNNNNLRLYRDYTLPNSNYETNRFVNGVPLDTYIYGIFGPAVDHDDYVKLENKKYITKHFGFYKLSTEQISSSHNSVIKVPTNFYVDQVKIELNRYERLKACVDGNGLMFGFIYDKDKAQHLISDSATVERLIAMGCDIYSDAMNMADMWSEKIDIPDEVTLLISDYYRIHKID